MIKKPTDLYYSYNKLSYKRENRLLPQKDIKIKDEFLTIDNLINMNDDKNNTLISNRNIREITLEKNKQDPTINTLISLIENSINNTK